MSSPRHALNLALSRLVVCALVIGSSEVLDAPRWAEQGCVVRAPPPGLAWALPWLDAGLEWAPLLLDRSAEQSRIEPPFSTARLER